MTRILVVEDNSNERNGLCRILERAGYDVRSAADGVEALQRIRDDKFDLLLVDIWMPRMNGLELLAHLPEDSRPKALVITGDESPDTLLRSLREKAHLFIAKPLQLEVLYYRQNPTGWSSGSRANWKLRAALKTLLIS